MKRTLSQIPAIGNMIEISVGFFVPFVKIKPSLLPAGFALCTPAIPYWMTSRNKFSF
jgi:hypothetical protein